MLQKTNPESFVRAETHRGCFKKLARGLSGGDPPKKAFKQKSRVFCQGGDPQKRLSNKNRESLVRAGTHRKCFNTKSREFGQGGDPQKMLQAKIAREDV